MASPIKKFSLEQTLVNALQMRAADRTGCKLRNHSPSWPSMLILDTPNMATQDVASANSTVYAKLESAVTIS